MAQQNNRLTLRQKQLLVLILVVLLPAWWVHLGLLTFIDDEAIRALVALEMELSGNYLTPTLYGALYFNKPPLYNWFLHLFFAFSGEYSEWASRAATVVCAWGYGLTVFFTMKKNLGTTKAALVALMVLTSFRILFYDSLLGLIDIGFSWVIYGIFWTVYQATEEKRWWKLFLLVYALATLGFLLKGLPVVVFTGLTLVSWLWYRGSLKKLWSLPHLAGLGLWIALVGLYYFLYAQSNDVGIVFETLLEESSKRTAAQYGWGKTVLHVFTFPFELIYHFLPWSVLLIPALWRLMQEKQLPTNSFLAFACLIGGLNLIPYWISVEVYPRYLFMFLPLLFAWGLGCLPETFWQQKTWFYWLGWAFIALFMLAAGIPLFWERLQITDLWGAKSLLLIAALATVLFFYRHWVQEQAWLLILALAIARMGFDWFVLPDRYLDDWGTQVKERTIEAVSLVPPDKPLYIYGRTAFQPTNAFYATRTHRAIIPRKRNNFMPGDYLIIDTAKYPEIPIIWKADFVVRYNNKTIQIGEYQGE